MMRKKVPMYLLALLMHWYDSQTSYVRWDNIESNLFSLSNGVRQGSLLSPLLFAFYMDDLSTELNSLPIGCTSGSRVLNHLFYADDIVLLSPSVIGLRRLVSCCEQYADSHDVIFNPAKSVNIRFASENISYQPGTIRVNGTALRWTDSVKYLGVTLTRNLDDRLEINSQMRNFYARANCLSRTFTQCSISVKLLLFQSFCLNFYLVHLWLKFPQFVFNRFRIAVNNMLRKLIGLPRYSSASEMFVFYRLDNVDAMIRKQRANFYRRLLTCENPLVRSFVDSFAFASSPLRLLIIEQTII